jgi:hypothetical protein
MSWKLMNGALSILTETPINSHMNEWLVQLGGNGARNDRKVRDS